MPGSYEVAYNKFNEKYGLNHNVYTEYIGMKALGTIDDFTMDTTPQQKEQKAYLSTLQSVLTTYLMKKTKMEISNTYDMSDVSLGEFIDEFDKVMKAIRTDEAEKEKQSYEHTPYAGFTLEQIAKEVKNRVRGFNRPLTDIWAKQIRNGTLSLEQVQLIANESIEGLNGVRAENIGEKEQKHLADIVMAKETMEKAIKARSFWSYLNPANWGPYRRETKFKDALATQIKAYEDAGINVKGAVPAEYGNNILAENFKALDSYVKDNSKINQTDAVVKENVEKKEPIASNENQSIKDEELINEEESNIDLIPYSHYETTPMMFFDPDYIPNIYNIEKERDFAEAWYKKMREVKDFGYKGFFEKNSLSNTPVAKFNKVLNNSPSAEFVFKRNYARLQSVLDKKEEERGDFILSQLAVYADEKSNLFKNDPQYKIPEPIDGLVTKNDIKLAAEANKRKEEQKAKDEQEIQENKELTDEDRFKLYLEDEIREKNPDIKDKNIIKQMVEKQFERAIIHDELVDQYPNITDEDVLNKMVDEEIARRNGVENKPEKLDLSNEFSENKDIPKSEQVQENPSIEKSIYP